MNLSNYIAVINNDYIKEFPNRKVRIKETDPSAKLRSVDICGFQSESNIVYSFDKQPPLSNYISPDSGYRKKCDAVVLTSYEGIDYLLFIELKSKNFSERDILDKFKSSRCFMDYIDSILKRFHNDNLLNECERRLIVFYQPRLNKTSTNAKLQPYRRIGNALKIPYTVPILLKQILNRQVS
ncbi:MAG: hypothetical protein P9X24_01820 [Candidatus Hatepunaea meridiana]|nr:hypothetical protein [Candidatus Hatepunaea meridiana]